MRTLCLLLILANVLYFTWSQMIDVYVPNLERKGAKPVEPPARIVLAREMIEANPDERSVGPILRGTAIGSVLGLLPGGGALIATFASYTVEKKLSKTPQE